MFKKLFIFFSISCSLIAEHKVLFDPYFSPYSGADNLLLAESLLLKGGDYFRDPYTRNSTSKVICRTLEQVLIWEGVNMLTAVTQHEVFGHGYRLRELDERVCGYRIGIDGGATYFDVDSSFKVGKMLAVTVAGLEAEAIFARNMKMHWISKGSIDGRQATLYTQTQQSLFFYTLITKGKLDGGEISKGNDIDGYMSLLNASYSDSDVNIGDLTRISLINWLDPMTFYAYFSWFYYISEGKDWNFPMITLTKNVKYLPNARIGYAPYGVEGCFENFFLIEGKPLYLYFKGGNRSLGIGMAYDYLFTAQKASLGFRIDGWQQNQFLTSATIGQIVKGQKLDNADSKNKVWGCSASLASTLKYADKLGFYAQLGAKSKGYLPGYSLDSDLVWRVGLSSNY